MIQYRRKYLGEYLARLFSLASFPRSRLLKSYTRGKKWRLRLRRTKPNLTKNTFIDSRTIEERIPFSVRNLIHRGIYGWICCARKEETGREVVALPVRG